MGEWQHGGGNGMWAHWSVKDWHVKAQQSMGSREKCNE